MARKKGETSIKIYQDWCKGCGICVAFCPAGVLRLNNQGKAEVAHEEECINCGFCEIHCPDFAISVQPKKMVGLKKNQTEALEIPSDDEESTPLEEHKSS
jgi:2-oxoglutarate ferredoxin oxidoreductase subunit delta